MAQLNDLLVSGASRLLNGLGILGTTNTDSIIPNTTETYELGSSSKKWKTAYVKTISANDMTLAILTVTNYATIGGGQAATAANTGALRITGGLSATQNSFFAKSIITTPGSSQGIKVNAAYITSADSANGEVVLQGGHLRFGGSSWDYNYWAGLKYDHSVKTIYLGIADNSIFKANAAQTGGTLALPAIRYLSINGKVAIDAVDGWLRINEGKAFATGVYLGSNVVRTDGQLQVGSAGANFYANSSGNGYFSNTLGIAGTNTSYKLYVNGKAKIGDGANSTSATTGGLQIAGGVGISGNSFFGGNITANTVIYVNSGTAAESRGLIITRSGAETESVRIGVNDSQALFVYKNDEKSNSFVFQMINADTENSDGSGANSATVIFSCSSGKSTVTADNFSGNATSANYLKDKTTGSASYLNYGASGMTSASWYGAWDGYTLRAISPTNLATHLATTTLDSRYVNMSGDIMSGPLRIDTSLTDHSSPTAHCLVINCSTGTPTLKNAPGIGFHIANVSWGSLIFDNGGFKFINNTSDGYMPVYASTFYGALSGNASTATALTSNAGSATQPVYFTGGKPVAIDFHIGNSSVGERNCNNITYNTVGYYQSNGPSGLGESATDGSIYAQAYNSSWVSQIAQDYRNGNLFIRGKNNGTWQSWKAVLTSDYRPMVFHWSGQSGQPTWLWGGTDGVNMYVYNPSNFVVAGSNYVKDYNNGVGTYFGYSTAGMTSCTWLCCWDTSTSGQYRIRGIQPGSLSVNYASSSGSSGYLSINNEANRSYGLQYMQPSSQTSGNDLPSSTWWHVIKMNHGTGDTYYKRLLAFDFWNDNIMTSGAAGDGVTRTWKQVWVQGNAVTGAVWNDYAEHREADTEEFGYVLMETGRDSLTKTTERLSHFAGVSSDTWGFSQGETSKAKTPIAVAGRVLVYTYQDRNNYKPGDCVCAAPGGTVDIMTREEVILWSDRVVGTVSQVPDYEEWGGGEMADRPAVKVDNRIWIKVK